MRVPAHLMTPIMSKTEIFEFPTDSIWHFVAYDAVMNGPANNDYYLRSIENKIFIEHVLKIAPDAKGSPRFRTENLTAYVREWQLQHPRFRLSQDIADSPKDPKNLGIVNYSLLTRAVGYVRSAYSEYYRWYNIQKTVWDKINAITLNSDRAQFLLLNIPKTLPSVAALDRASTGLDTNNLSIFNNHESLFILELWKWMSMDHRLQSVMGNLSHAQLAKVNLIFIESGRWICVNMGVLDNWRYIKTKLGPDATPEQKVAAEQEDAKKTKIPPVELQKRFLRTMMTLMENRTVAVNDDIEVIQTQSDKKETEVSPLDEQNQNEHSDEMLKTLNEDLAQLETLEIEANTRVDQDKEPALNVKALVKAGRSDSAPRVLKFERSNDPKVLLKAQCDKLADDGLLSPAEYRRKQKQFEVTDNIPAPKGTGLLTAYIQIPPEDIELKEPAKIKDMYSIVDKSMLETSLNKFDKNYITKVLSKDIASMVVAGQKAGYVLTNYEVEEHVDILGKFEMHTMRIAPLEGLPSTIRFKVPKVEDTGTWKAGGIEYFPRKQRGDLPIRKITSSRVALSSYYGKTFVSRSEKKTNDYGTWLQNQIRELALTEGTAITEMHPAAVFDPAFDCPRTYSILAHAFRTLTIKGYHFYFNHKERENIFTPEEFKKYEKDGVLLVAKSDAGLIVGMDNNAALYFQKDGKFEPMTSFEHFCDIVVYNTPTDFAQAKIFGKNIPVAFVLSYKYGFAKLMEKLGVTPRRVPSGSRLSMQQGEYVIEFSDEKLIFSKDDQLATMVLAGWNEYARSIKNYSVHTLDRKGVYLNILEHHGLTAKYLREIDQLDDMFVDPITEELLLGMKEPTSYRGLLVRSAELLINDQHAHSLDMRQMRIKGHERIAGAVYGELVKITREHRAKPGRANAQFSMNPYAVWKAITTDPAVSIVEDINPIMNLKEGESTTYGGTGGRNARAMIRGAREYHPSDLGVISESTTDSGDVAINTYTSANPQFDSVRGTTFPADMKNPKASSLLSTTALLHVGSTHDDMKRTNFTSIQNNHGVACVGYHPNYVRTGYEQVIAHRVGKGFATTAEQDGVVVSRDDNGMVIQYKDGTKEGIQLGRRYGSAGGLTLAHEMTSEFDVGHKFKAEDVLAYNAGFFERDRFNPSNVLFKMGLLCNVALLESKQTHEDACSISVDLSNRLQTKTTKIKDVMIGFTQQVTNVLAQGSTVDHDSILCVIEDSSTAGANLFDKDSLNTLRMLSSQTPTAKVKGIVERIEVFYNGDIEDMHPSLATLTEASDKQLAKRQKSMGESAMTGMVDESFRIEGDPLLRDSLCIRFYITSDVGAGIGDKVVFANQLKSVISEIMEYKMFTKSGQQIDAIFGSLSIFNRIVQNPFIIGTTNELSSIVSKNAAKIYKGEMKP